MAQITERLFCIEMSCKRIYAPAHFNFVMFNTVYLMNIKVNANSEDLK